MNTMRIDTDNSTKKYGGRSGTTTVAHPAPTAERRSRSGRRPSRRVVGLVGTLVAVLVAASIGVSAPASAAAGWRWLDLDRDGWNETAAWVDNYGRYTTVYSDPDQNGVWNVYGSINPSTGRWTQIHFDTNGNRTWDTLMQWKSNGTTLLWSNTGSEFDGNWDALTVAVGSTVTVQCVGQNQSPRGFPMDQSWGAWWFDCHYPYSGSGLSGLITGPIYTNMFDSLRAATGVSSSYCMYHLYGDPTC